jgi:thiamine-phosphate pyrophosphorylase
MTTTEHDFSARATLSGRSLYLCTPDRPDLESFVAHCIEGGVDIVQLRDKVLDARPIIERALVLKRVCGDYGVPFILNDRPDLALEVDADGVHVGQDDAPPALARRILGPDKIVGLSTHHIEDLESARSEPVDYLSAGPVVPTPTKPGRPGTGISYVALASEKALSWRPSGLPVFITGGVTPEVIPELAAHGVRHFVVVRYLTESDDPERAARLLRQAIDRSVPPA